MFRPTPVRPNNTSDQVNTENLANFEVFYRKKPLKHENIDFLFEVFALKRIIHPN